MYGNRVHEYLREMSDFLFEFILWLACADIASAADTDMDWAYWFVPASIEVVFRPRGNDTYDLVVLVSIRCSPGVVTQASHHGMPS